MAGGSGSVAGGAAGSASGGGGASGGQAQAGGGAGGGGAGGSGGAGGTGGMAGAGGMTPFVLTSPAFEHVETCSNDNRDTCELFPAMNVMTTIGGTNQSPELNWGTAPVGTMSYVMCLHDNSNGNTHWCLWNIPPATVQLPANLARQKMPALPTGSEQDSFSGNDDGYMGPGAPGNVYHFELFALNIPDYEPPNAQNRETVFDELVADPDNVVIESLILRGRSDPEGYN
jgi:Raf kinase inhibitor-like YbhB/YbcL family protein